MQSTKILEAFVIAAMLVLLVIGTVFGFIKHIKYGYYD